ncbi:hypothetical protein HDU98_004984 [Podochytrium sp. JEL0797]|nr:hypothetical protein HDU98_004984 [Podochytrium sp. JEL0797]
MANVTADYQRFVSIKAVAGDVTVEGVLVSFAIQTLIALACIASFSFLRPRGPNKYIFQPKLEFDEAREEEKIEPLEDSLVGWSKPIFRRHKGKEKVTRLGLDATMFLEFNKLLFVAFAALTLLGLPYAFFNYSFANITGASSNNGIDPTVYQSVANNGSVVVAGSNNSIVGVGPTAPAPALPSTTSTPTSSNSWAPSPTIAVPVSFQIRCGSSWDSANATCGPLCQTDTDCPSGLLCFKDVISCSASSRARFVTTRDHHGSPRLTLRDDSGNSPSINSANTSIIIASGLSSLTITQIDASSPWFWLPTILTWVFSAIVYAFLYKLLSLYIKHRQFYFTTDEFKNSLAHRTLFLTYIPKIETSKELIAFMHERDASLEIQEATINRNVSLLGKLVKEHKDKTKELERFLIGVFEAEDAESGEVRRSRGGTGRVGPKEEHLESMVEIHHIHETDGGEEPGTPKDEYHFQSKTDKVKDDLLKQLRTKAKTQSERDAEIKDLEHEIDELEVAIEAIRTTSEHEHPSNESGFLSLATPQQAHALIKTLRSHPKYVKKFGGVHIKFAPEFPDIFWANIGRPQPEIYGRRFLAVLATIGLTIGWILLLGLLSTLQNLTVLFQNNPSALAWLQAHPGWQNFLQTFLCPIPLAIANWLLPLILLLITFLQGVKSGAGATRSILYKNYTFNMIQIFLFALISGMIHHSNKDTQLPTFVLSDPEVKQVVTVIESLTQNSYFYITMLASFYAGFGMEILQSVKLGISFVRRKVFKLTPRDEFEMNGMTSMDFVQFYGTLVMAFTISLTFSIIAPMILPFAMLFFGITFVVMKYQLMYVYEIEQETFGSFFPKIFNLLSTSVLFFQLTTLLVVFAGNATTPSAPAFQQWMVLAPLPFLTATLWILARFYRIPQGVYCVSQILDLSDVDPESPRSPALASSNSVQSLSLHEQSFNTEFVAPLPRVHLPLEFRARSKQYYTPRVRAQMDPRDARTRAWVMRMPTLEARKRDIVCRMVRGGGVGYEQIRGLSIEELEALGGVPPEVMEEVRVQRDVERVERERGMLGEVGVGECEVAVKEHGEFISESVMEEKPVIVEHNAEDLVMERPVVEKESVIEEPIAEDPVMEEPIEDELLMDGSELVEPIAEGLVIADLVEPVVIEEQPEVREEDSVDEIVVVPPYAAPLVELEDAFVEEPIDTKEETSVEEEVPIVKPELEQHVEPSNDEPEIYFVPSHPKVVTMLKVDVVNPREHVEGKDHYVEYEVVSKTDIPGFAAEGDVRRRYKDFDAFRNDLVYEFPE